MTISFTYFWVLNEFWNTTHWNCCTSLLTRFFRLVKDVVTAGSFIRRYLHRWTKEPTFACDHLCFHEIRFCLLNRKKSQLMKWAGKLHITVLLLHCSRTQHVIGAYITPYHFFIVFVSLFFISFIALFFPFILHVYRAHLKFESCHMLCISQLVFCAF